MARPLRILLRRNRGGNGDQLCCLVALRTARQLYPDAYLVHAVGNPYYGLVYAAAIQLEHADECIAPPLWSDLGDAAFIEEFRLDTFDRVINLDGPEVAYAHSVNWKIRKSRQEIWCDEVLKGHEGQQYPADMVPRLMVDPKRRYALVNQMSLGGLRPFEYVAVHWKSADFIKDYPHNRLLIEALRDRGHRVVVMHNDPIPDLSLPDKPVWTTSGMSAQNHAMLCEMAQAVICPDSFILHLAAAVNCPTIGLFSSTNGAVTCKHYPLVTVVQNTQVGGKPCEHTFPCYGLFGQNCWCSTREDGMDSVPWCLEQIGHTSIVAMLEQNLEANAAINQERKKKVIAELEEASVVQVDRKRYTSKGRKPLVVGVPPGIGDSLWAMVKVQDIMRQDEATDLIVCMQETQPARGKEFIDRLGFVSECSYKSFSIHQQGEFYILPNGHWNYSGGPGGAMRNYMGMDWLLMPNTPLERGEPLDTWLPEYAANWNVMKDHFQFLPTDDLVADRVSSQLKGRGWVTFFLGGRGANGMLDENGRYHTVSGKNRARRYTKRDWEKFHYSEALWRQDIDVRPVWLLEYWIELARKIVEDEGLGIVLVGANWPEDREYAQLFVEFWAKSGGDPAAVVNVVGGTHVAEAFRVTMGGKSLFSFQSGIGVGSEYLGVKTAIWWRADGDSEECPPDGDESKIGRQFVSLSEKMRDAWSPPWAIESGSHLGLVYGRETPRQIYDEAKRRGWFGDG